jgi:hypothetical protein
MTVTAARAAVVGIRGTVAPIRVGVTLTPDGVVGARVAVVRVRFAGVATGSGVASVRDSVTAIRDGSSCETRLSSSDRCWRLCGRRAKPAVAVSRCRYCALQAWAAWIDDGNRVEVVRPTRAPESQSAR